MSQRSRSSIRSRSASCRGVSPFRNARLDFDRVEPHTGVSPGSSRRPRMLRCRARIIGVAGTSPATTAERGTPMKPVGLLLFAIAMLCAGPRVAAAADPRYPDWPCVQAKVPDLSIAALWDGPSIEQAQKTWQDDPTIKNLVARLAARRIPIEEAQKSIEDFLAGASAGKADKGVMLFAG